MTKVAPERRTRPIVQRVRHTVDADRRVDDVSAQLRWQVVGRDHRVGDVVFEDRGPSARIGVTIIGITATATAQAPDGSVVAVRDVTVTGVPATATAEAPPGRIEFVVHATIIGATATATAAASEGAVQAVRNVTLPGVVATASAAAPAGTVTTIRNTTISGLVAAATAQAPTGTIQAVRNTTLAGVTATATAQAPAGTVTAVVNLTRQRLYLPNTWTSTGDGQVTGWASDPTYPATVSNNALVVQGTGTLYIRLAARIESSVSRTLNLRVNGTSVWSKTYATRVTETNAAQFALHDGDVIDLYWSGGGGGTRYIYGDSSIYGNAYHSYLEVSPT